MTPPEEIHHVSQTQLSIARYYGGAKVFGVDYVYDPLRDVLIREDVLRARGKAEREAKRKAKTERAARPGPPMFPGMMEEPNR